MTKAPRHALVLAGSRGPTDPVASARGLPHKALVPVAGVPMLERVADTLLVDTSIEQVILSADAGLLEHGLGPALSTGIEAGEIKVAKPRSSPSESVAAVLDDLSPDAFPLLVTTADHPLLSGSMVEHFCAHAPEDADFVLGLAEAATIRARHPDAVRTFYRFKGQGYSGCNLFLLRTPDAHRIVTFWQEMECHRKRPWRLVAAVGLLPLLRFLANRLSLEEALAHLGKLVGARIGMVAMPFAEAAIDVDKPADLDLVEMILAHRSKQSDQRCLDK